MPHPEWPAGSVGNGPVHVISATADQIFKDITPAEEARLPRYTGEMELTNHSAGSLTSQAYQKLKLAADLNGVTISVMVRQCVQYLLDPKDV